MQSALAKLDGIEKDDVTIDYAAKTVEVDVAGTEYGLDDLAMAFEGTNYGIAN